MESLIPAYITALCKEIEYFQFSESPTPEVYTIYFGGGTPSLVKPVQLERILEAVSRKFGLASGVEISIEMNPGTVEDELLKGYRRLGVNRVSIGMQSSHPLDLCLLQRTHDYGNVINSVSMCRDSGLDNINLDLIFGIPGQDETRWEQTLSLALGLMPAHLSIYGLTIEEGTPLHRWFTKGMLVNIDEDKSASMYEQASELLEQYGYRHYEISNWALSDEGDTGTFPVAACKHNIQYWLNQPYLGFGVGAHSFYNGVRFNNNPDLFQYIEDSSAEEPVPDFGSFATREIEIIDPSREEEETMMMGLRLTEAGVANANFTQRFGRSILDAFGDETARMIGFGLLEWSGADFDRLRLTRRGHLLGNLVFREFLRG